MNTHDFPRLGRFTLRIPALNLILLVTGLFFLGQVMLDRTVNASMAGGGFAGSEISGATCWALGSSSVRSLQSGEPWRLVACVFLHGGLLHFLMNAFSLWQLGRAVQDLFGGTRLLGVYLATGVAAALVSDAWCALSGSSAPSVGASGAVCGLMGLLLAHMRRRNDIVAQHVGKQLIGWAVVNAVIGMLIPNINNAAHAGGFFAGYAIDWLIEGKHSRKVARQTVAWTTGLTVLCIAALLWAGAGANSRAHKVQRIGAALLTADAVFGDGYDAKTMLPLAQELEEASEGTSFAAEGAHAAAVIRLGSRQRDVVTALQKLYAAASQDCAQDLLHDSR